MEQQRRANGIESENEEGKESEKKRESERKREKGRRAQRSEDEANE